MVTQKYQNLGTHDGAQSLFITVEQVEDEADEHYGLYRVTDANNVVGHITEEQLHENWAVVEDTASDKAKKGA